jgi:hypothetical protein
MACRWQAVDQYFNDIEQIVIPIDKGVCHTALGAEVPGNDADGLI